jgi:hypothetical protein
MCHRFRPKSTFSHSLARAKSNEGGYLATLAAQRWNKAMGQFWRANPGQFSRVPKLGGFKVQWHTLSRWFANVEIKVRLFVTFGVLLSPQYQQKRRKLGKDNFRPVDLRVTPRTESDHQMQN